MNRSLLFLGILAKNKGMSIQRQLSTPINRIEDEIKMSARIIHNRVLVNLNLKLGDRHKLPMNKVRAINTISDK
jgi:hypothetical protein